MSINVGSKAPDFSAMANGGKSISLNDYSGKWLVLYFYPKDNTSGCTKQACGFRDNLESLKAMGAEVLGVSPDSAKSHDGFIEKQQLNFDLIADTEKTIAQSYDAWGEKSMYGKKYMGIVRSTYIINPNSDIVAVWKNVKVPGHVDAVKAKLIELQSA